MVLAMSIRNWWPGALSALLVCLVLATQVSAQSQPAAGRDTVVLGLVSDPELIHPIFTPGSELLTAIFTRNVERDIDTWRVFPQGVEYLPNGGTAPGYLMARR